MSLLLADASQTRYNRKCYHVLTRRHKKSPHLREGEALSVNPLLPYLKRLIRLCLARLDILGSSFLRSFPYLTSFFSLLHSRKTLTHTH
jgi:hypothetical protein